MPAVVQDLKLFRLMFSSQWRTRGGHGCVSPTSEVDNFLNIQWLQYWNA